MPWWSWVLIWGGLVVLLVAVLVVGGISLFRKVQLLAAEADRLESITQQLRDELESNPPVRAEPKPAAILRPREAVREERRAYVEARNEAKQLRHEAKLRRARALIATDPKRFQHLVDAKTKGN
ncbi:hypothetical protein [Gulosibacter bifidus]|uniref:Uncharacterized protein n=1 Tax=Gulosibacter bifidus TaxID=272239 RepID=A0ABW5RFY3_9MICO|nr:hypothetical protein [Gulosibacter bifidus]